MRAGLQALHAMFARFGYSEIEAETRARVLYYMQIGYDLAQLNEPMETRIVDGFALSVRIHRVSSRAPKKWKNSAPIRSAIGKEIHHEPT